MSVFSENKDIKPAKVQALVRRGLGFCARSLFLLRRGGPWGRGTRSETCGEASSDVVVVPGNKPVLSEGVGGRLSAQADGEVGRVSGTSAPVGFFLKCSVYENMALATR